MNLSRFLIILLILAGVNYASAQSFVIEGRVCDKTDNEDLIGATIRTLSLPDSTFISASSASRRRVHNGEEELTSQFSIALPSRKSSYLLEVSATGYEPTFIKVTPSEYGERIRKAELPIILLSPKAHEVGGVTVSTSRIKFFNRGDTVVFNADAFHLANGSMLDALVSQLPGVELKPNGQIYYNGKYIESLLLDGKHFFNGDNQLMLENIGAYSVKDIRIYDKSGDASEFAGRQLGGDKELVMDVKLKKEYATGLLVNAEAGIGTNQRYIGRLFGMWFTSDTRVSIYGSSNNLNDDRKPGRSDSWSPADLKSGVSEVNTGGLDYSIDKKLKGIKADGNIIVKHNNLNDETGIYRTNFLASGDTYTREERRNKARDFNITTRHNLYVRSKSFDFTLTPRFEYDNTHSHSTTASATFADNAGGITFEGLTSAPGYLSDFINRYVNENLKKGEKFTGNLSANSRIKLHGTQNILRVGVDGYLTNLREDRFNRYTLTYSNPEDASADYDRYFKNRPDNRYRVSATAGYNMALGDGTSLEISYRFNHSAGKSTSSLFNLHELADEQSGELGSLPSMNDYIVTLDRNNSYRSRTLSDDHVIAPFFVFEKNNFSGQINIPLSITSNRLEYQRGAIDTTIVRHTALLNVENTFLQWLSTDKTKKVELAYSLRSEAPDLVNMVNMTDTTDPLNVYEGSSDLRNSHLHQFTLSSELMNPARPLMQYITARFSFINNALARGYDYDTATGIRRYRTYNINGNWDGSLSYGIGLQFGPQQKMMLQSMTTASTVNSVDFIGENESGAQRQTVVSRGLNEILKLNYSIGKGQIGINADVTYRHYSDMTSLSIWNQKYGATATITLIKDLQLSTDFSIFTRSGFTDNALNTTDLVWNARLSYTMMKGRLTAMLDGFDMLHNLSNVSYSVNAQAKTETYINVLPRYFMFHLQWRFNRQPKKRR